MEKGVEVSEVIEWFVEKGKVRNDFNSDLSESESKDLLSLHLIELSKENKNFEKTILETFEGYYEN